MSRPRRRLAGIGLIIAIAQIAHTENRPWPKPGDADSHERFLEHLRGSEALAFRQLLGRYDEYLNENPWDVRTKVERCRFLGLASCDEEEGTCGYRGEHEQCVAELREEHPMTAEFRLYDLESMWGEEAITAADALLEGEARYWRTHQQAALHEKLTLVHSYDENHEDVIGHALQAMRLDPALDLSLIAARASAAQGDEQRAIELLLRRMAVPSDYWKQTRKIDLLAELGAHAHAAHALGQLEVPVDVYADYLMRARVFGQAGRIDEARQTLIEASESPSVEWQASAIHGARFQLELTHGDAESAIAYYETFRDTGFVADPFLRQRLRLASRYPGAPWQARDALGGLVIAAAILFILAMPGALLLPVHYIGLRRTIAMPGHVPVRTRWRLRHAWIVLGILGLADVPFLYMEGIDILDDMGSAMTGGLLLGEVDYSSVPTPSLALGGLLGTLIGYLGLLTVFRRVDLARLGRGTWSIGRIIGFAAVSLFALRMFLGMWVLLLPDSVREAMDLGSTLSLQVNEILRAIGDVYGGAALFVFAVLAIPILEEILFRGVLLDALRRHLPFGWANFLQALLFASLHEAFGAFPFFLAMGLVTGQLARRSGSLLASILVHAGNNAVATLLLMRQLGGA